MSKGSFFQKSIFAKIIRALKREGYIELFSQLNDVKFCNRKKFSDLNLLTLLNLLTNLCFIVKFLFILVLTFLVPEFLKLPLKACKMISDRLKSDSLFYKIK